MELGSQTRFSISREARDRFCKTKDAALLPILEDISILDPRSFRAILMPSLYGIEGRFLVDKGVSARNIFAVEDNSVERDFDTHDEIVNCRLPDRQEMKGMMTTSRPMRLPGALDEAWFALGEGPVNLIYLDFLSQPDPRTHYVGCLRKIVKGPMLVPGGVLILNFGRSRCRHEVAEFNRVLDERARALRGTKSHRDNAKVLIEAAVEQWGRISLSRPIESVSYTSGSQVFTTTVATF